MFTLTIPATLVDVLRMVEQYDKPYGGILFDAESGCLVATNGFMMVVTQPGQLIATGDARDTLFADVAESMIVMDDGSVMCGFDMREQYFNANNPLSGKWREVYAGKWQHQQPMLFDLRFLQTVRAMNVALGKTLGLDHIYADEYGRVALHNDLAHAIIMPMRDEYRVPVVPYPV